MVKEPREVPDGYFEEFQERMTKLVSEDSQKRPTGQSIVLWKRLAGAAAIMLIGLSIWKFSSQADSAIQAGIVDLSTEEAFAYAMDRADEFVPLIDGPDIDLDLFIGDEVGPVSQENEDLFIDELLEGFDLQDIKEIF